MRKFVVVLGSIGFLSLFAMPVWAKDLVLNDNQIKVVAEACVKSQAALKRVHTSDALLRVNIGQRYENISLRFMAPLNSRVALNGFDVVDLATTAADYAKELKSFVENYKQYETVVATALKLKCIEQPVDYYAHIEQARVGRAKVRVSMTRLDELIEKYRSQVVKFKEEQSLK